MADSRRRSSIGWFNGAQIKVIQLVFSYSLAPRRAPQYKKHKTWDGDAVLQVIGNTCTLFDNTDGRQCVLGVINGYMRPSYPVT